MPVLSLDLIVYFSQENQSAIWIHSTFAFVPFYQMYILPPDVEVEACICKLLYTERFKVCCKKSQLPHKTREYIWLQQEQRKWYSLESWSRKIFLSMTFALSRSYFQVFSLINLIDMTNIFHTILNKLYFYEHIHRYKKVDLFKSMALYCRFLWHAYRKPVLSQKSLKTAFALLGNR